MFFSNESRLQVINHYCSVKVRGNLECTMSESDVVEVDTGIAGKSQKIAEPRDERTCTSSRNRGLQHVVHKSARKKSSNR